MTGLEVLQAIGWELGPHQSGMVFTGGLVLPVYFERPPRLRLRPTIDADAVVACKSYPRWAALQAALMRDGFAPVSDPDAPIYRMRSPQGYLLDLMPTDPEVLGSGNRWFHLGYERAIRVPIGGGALVKVFPAPLYMAAKAEAFCDRGKADPWTSHDLEDLLTPLACRPSLPVEVAREGAELRHYLADFAVSLLATDRIEEVADSHLRDQGNEALAVLMEIARLG